MGVDGVDTGIQRPPLPPDASPDVSTLGVVLLGDLRRCPVVAVRHQSTCRAVVVERGIDVTVGGKERQPPWLCKSYGACCTPQVVGAGTGTVGRQQMGAAPQRLQAGQLAQLETRVHDQSQAHLYLVHAEVQLFQTSHVAQLEVVAVVVVAHLVAVAEERLAGILGSCNPELDAVVVVKLIADVVTVLVS